MKIKKLFMTLFCIGLFSTLLAGTALAGSVYVSDDYIELEEGDSTYVSLTFDEAAGHFSVSSSGSVYANDEDFLDDDSYGIGISATGTGYGEVIIYLDDVADYDENDLSGESIVIEVNVFEPEAGDTDYGKSEDDNAPDSSDDETEDETTEKETEPETKVSKLDVKVDDKDYTVLTDLKGLELPKGFTEKEETFEGEKVKVLQYKENIKLFALKNKTDESVLFYTYDPATKKFTKPLSMTQEKKTYYFLELPVDTDIPGYQKKEVTLNGETIQALASDYAGMEDYCFLYAMCDGKENFYCVDNKENTIQKVSKFSIPLDDHAKQLDAKKIPLLENKPVLIGGAAALALIIFFLIMWLVTNKKYREVLEDLEDVKADRRVIDSYDYEEPETVDSEDLIENIDFDEFNVNDDFDDPIDKTDFEVPSDKIDFDAPIDYEDTIGYDMDKDMDDVFEDISFDDFD